MWGHCNRRGSPCRICKARNRDALCSEETQSLPGSCTGSHLGSGGTADARLQVLSRQDATEEVRPAPPRSLLALRHSCRPQQRLV
ncbi:hypothetical protein J6590_013900 [Homalodisca vitripennis]|nr:hypothetical protein J6590_013900 [Homalodisca vitripennis]